MKVSIDKIKRVILTMFRTIWFNNHLYYNNRKQDLERN